MIADIKAAIAAEKFFMYYQPQYCVQTGAMGGAEALVRWKDSHGVFIPPDVFIPLIEEANLHEELTNIVVGLVVQDYRVFSANGHNISLSINVSAKDLKEGNFIPPFLRALEKYQCDPSSFKFEITETAIVDDYKECIKNVALLKAIGCRVSLDDFGTGHASCKYVRSFPMDEIKIDRFFISDITENDIDLTIAKFMVELAHKLGCAVVAEGVEDRATAEVLESIKCDFIQGYWYSRPLTSFDLVDFANAHRTRSV